MTGSHDTLASFVLPTADADGARKALDVVASSELQAHLAKVDHLDWSDARDVLADGLAEALDVDLLDLLVRGWSKFDEIRDCVASNSNTGDELARVCLVDHTIRSTHYPKLEVRVADQKIGEIVFDVELSLTISGLALKIRNGRLCEIATGSCAGKGSIKLGDKVLLQQETKAFELPGTLDIGTGVEIPPP